MAAEESWRQARSELESFLKEQPENHILLGDLALTDMSLGDKAAALTLAERGMTVNPIEKDAVTGPASIEFFARVAAQAGEADRAITALQKLLSTSYSGPLGPGDSVGGVIESPAKCRHCGATTRLGNGLCLSCTLREGLEGDREASRESFEAILAEDEVRDTHWRIGNYEILEEIGRGGMGVIYRARQRHSRRIVALKRMVSYHADSGETLERFRREAEAAASLDHPNILPIYEVGQAEDGLPFFSMKYAAGGSLQKAEPALRGEPRECVRLMAKVARAVQYAHEHGVLHRDLKPGNILLDGRGEPFVTDFGLAKWLDTATDLTRSLAIFGTPGYIAPEQAKGPAAKLTPAADVYSLGAILFDLFTGRPPFLGEHALAVIQQATESRRPNCARSRRRWIVTWRRSARGAWSASRRRAIARQAI